MIVDVEARLEHLSRNGGHVSGFLAVVDRRAIAEFCAAHALPIVGEIPYDESLIVSERAGVRPIDADPSSPAVTGVRTLARTLSGAGRELKP